MTGIHEIARRSALHGATVLGMIVLSFPASSDPVDEWFARSCDTELATTADQSPTRDWLGQLCPSDAHSRATEFRTGDQQDRINTLAAHCRSWFDRNAYRFSPRVT